MASVIKINAGEFSAAVKFATGKVSKKRKKPFPLLIEEQTEGTITIIDAEFHKNGMDIKFIGVFDTGIEIDGPKLLRITSTYPSDADIVICTDDNNLLIKYQKSKISIPRLDKGNNKTKKKPLPHIKPPEQNPDHIEKYAEFDDTWAFSARVPMPENTVKKPKEK